MSLPQGINLRSTSGFVTDGPDEYAYTFLNAFSGTYPKTTPQGNTVGWEGGVGNARDRNASLDRRLAGAVWGGGADFRIDLPSAGSYNVRLAAGDAGSTTTVSVSLVDGSTVLTTLASGATSSGSFRDATNAVLTAANWPGSNAAYNASFSTTICRFRVGANSTTAHFYVEAAGGGSITRHTLAGSNSTQANTSGTGTIVQRHELNGAPGSQAHDGSSGDVIQRHRLSGAASVQSNTSAVGALVQRHVLVGAPGSQSNDAGTGSVIQHHQLAASDAEQVNQGSTGALALAGQLAGAPGSQANTGSTGTIVQRHRLAAANADQANQGSSGAISIHVDPRYARPQSDVATGTWTASDGGTLSGVLNELSADEATFVQTTQPSEFEVRLNPVRDPGTSSGQVVRYQTWSPYGNPAVARLKQGATIIAEWPHAALPLEATVFARELTPAQANSITNYTDLRVAVEAL